MLLRLCFATSYFICLSYILTRVQDTLSLLYSVFKLWSEFSSNGLSFFVFIFFLTVNIAESYQKIWGTIQFQTSKSVDIFSAFHICKKSYFSVLILAGLAISITNHNIFQCYSILICSCEKAHQGSKFLVRQLLMINITHLLKFAVKVNLNIVFKPKFYFQEDVIFKHNGMHCERYFPFLLGDFP